MRQIESSKRSSTPSRPWTPNARATARRSHPGPAQMPLDLDVADLLALQHARRFAKNPEQADRGPRPGDAFAEGDVALAVLAFHEAFGLPRQAMPDADYVTSELAALRLRLQREETEELAEAIEAGDVVGVADALADLVYVAYGTAITYGIDLDAVLAEVHRSNMSKLGRDGRPVMREDGKVLKSPWYTPPDVDGVLKQQLPLPLAW
jgi:predicted HAD superfamily Cof-like phosphohydrolase